MMRAINKTCCVQPARQALLAMILGLCVVVAAPRTAGAQPGMAEDQLPDAGDVVAAYMKARAWVDAFALPGVELDAARVPIANASGVCAIVRRGGRIMGMGVDDRGDELMLRRAVGRALSQVWTNDVVKRMPDSVRNSLGPELALELEVAGPLIPLPGRTFEDVSRKLEPGLDGIAMRRGERVEMRFPSQMLASNLAGRVRSLLPGMARDLELNPRPLDELRRQHGVSVYRFRTTHLTQHAPDALPIELFRGDKIVYLPKPPTRDRLVAVGEAISAHVKLHMWSGNEPLGLMGDYLPTADRYEPILAPAADQAFVAFALARFAHAAVGDNEALELATRLGLSRDILHALADRTSDEPDPTDDVFTSAMIVHAGLANELALGYRPAREMFARAIRTLLQSWDPQRGFVYHIADDAPSDAGQTRPLAAQQQAVCAAAVAALTAAGHDDEVSAAGLDARMIVDATWQPVEQSLNLLPWLAWAEAAVASIGRDSTGQAISHFDTLATALARAQWSGPDANLADCADAFPVSGGSGSLAFSAQSLRPMAFLAHWSRSEHASDARLARQTAEAAVRYLLQLIADEQDAWRYPNKIRSNGGVRNATWDSRQPLAAQAMALLALAELIEGR